MSKTLEDEISELKENNENLAQKVQHWKMIAAQREEEKIELMKELNQMRMNMSHYRNSSSTLDSVLESAVQEFGEQTITKLVDVSNSLTRTVEVMKSYIRKKQEIERASPSKSTSLLESPKERSSNKILRVVPMIRGRSIGKPIILLQQIDAAAYGIGQNEREETITRQEEVRTAPRHLLQEVYIPLHRIDAESLNVNPRTRRTIDLNEEVADTSVENAEIRLEGEEGIQSEMENERNERQGEVDETQNSDELMDRKSMETVIEESEDENWSPQVLLCKQPPNDSKTNTPRSNIDNPLEGPSWLLDKLYNNTSSPIVSKTALFRTNQTDKARSSEPDSTTDNSQKESNPGPVASSSPGAPLQPLSAESPLAQAHTPTRRVRRRHSHSRVSLALIDEIWSQPDPPSEDEIEPVSDTKDPTKALVMVAKMRIEDLSGRTSLDVTPKRKTKLLLEAPSPNGSTQDAGPIVMDTSDTLHASEMKPVLESLEKLQLKNMRRPSKSREPVHRKRSQSREKSNERSRQNSKEYEQTDGTSGENKQKNQPKKVLKSLSKTSQNPGRSSERRSTQGRLTGEDSTRHKSTGVEDRERSSDSESDSNSGESRPKRPRKAPPNYKEKPLNRKLRRQD